MFGEIHPYITIYCHTIWAHFFVPRIAARWSPVGSDAQWQDGFDHLVDLTARLDVCWPLVVDEYNLMIGLILVH